MRVENHGTDARSARGGCRLKQMVQMLQSRGIKTRQQVRIGHGRHGRGAGCGGYRRRRANTFAFNSGFEGGHVVAGVVVLAVA